MHILGLVLACLAYAIGGRRLQRTGESKQGSSSVDESLRQLLSARNPAVGWRAFGAGQGHSFAPSVQPTRFTQPRLAKLPEKPYYPAKRGINAIGFRKEFRGGGADEAMAESMAIQKYGQARYKWFDPNDPEPWKSDATWYQRQQAKRKFEEMKEETQENYAAQKKQVLQDHAFLTLIGSAAVWYFFSLKICVSYAMGAAFGWLFLYLLAQSIDGFAPESIDDVSRAPPPLVAPLLMLLITFKKKEVYFVVAVMVGFISHLVAVVLQATYPEGWGAEKEEPKEEQLPTPVTES